MQLIRTSLRLDSQLKKAAERIALEEEATLQQVFHEALRDYVRGKAEKKAKRMIFKTHDLGAPLDQMTRTDFYPEPQR